MFRSSRAARRVAGLVGCAGLLAALSGCWGVPGQGADRRAHNVHETRINATTVSGLVPAWTAAAPEAVGGDPVLTAGGVYVHSETLTYGFSAPSGALLWSHEVTLDNSPALASQPMTIGNQVVARGHLLFFSIAGGDVLNARTGAVEGPAGSYAAIRGDFAVSVLDSFNSSGFPDIRFEALNLADPSKNWGDGWSGPVNPGPLSDPTVGRSAFYLEAFGRVRAYPFTEPPDIVPPPTDGSARKQQLWESDATGVVTEIVLSQDQATAFVGAAGGLVHAIDTATGDTRWTADVGADVTAAPALDGSTLFVPTADGDLVVVAAATGAVQWAGATGSSIGVQPAIAGPAGGAGVVFTGSADGGLHAFPTTCPAASCAALWSADAGGSVHGAPAVTNGRLYVVAGGDLIAYRLGG